MALTTEQAMRLLDFSQKPNIPLLDTVVNCFYNSAGPEVCHCVRLTACVSLYVWQCVADGGGIIIGCAR